MDQKYLQPRCGYGYRWDDSEVYARLCGFVKGDT